MNEKLYFDMANEFIAVCENMLIATEAEDITKNISDAKDDILKSESPDQENIDNSDIDTNTDNIFGDDNKDEGENDETESTDDSTDSEDESTDEENTGDYSSEDEEEEPTDSNPEDESELVKKKVLREKMLLLRSNILSHAETLDNFSPDISNNDLLSHLTNIKENFDSFYKIINKILMEEFRDGNYSELTLKYVSMKNLYENLLRSIDLYVELANKSIDENKIGKRNSN